MDEAAWVDEEAYLSPIWFSETVIHLQAVGKCRAPRAKHGAGHGIGAQRTD